VAQIKASVICLGLLPNSYSEPPTLEFGCTTDNSHNLSILSFLDGPPAKSYFALPITEQSNIWEVCRPSHGFAPYPNCVRDIS
jgi:hypothetical protein